MRLKQTHGVLLGPVAQQPEVGAHWDMAYITHSKILHKSVKFQLCGSFCLPVYKEQTDRHTNTQKVLHIDKDVIVRCE
jgi:hypothetical protein